MALVNKKILKIDSPILGDVDFEANATRFNPNKDLDIEDNSKFDLLTPQGFDTSPNFINLSSVDNVRGKKVKRGKPTGKDVITEPNFFDKLYDNLQGSDSDLLGSALDIIPLVGAGITKNKADGLFDSARLSSEDADFRLGQVSDLARPNFATPARAPQGSSLAERTAAEKFGDVAQRGQEGAFEIENSKFREAKRESILGRENAQTQFNVGRQDKVDAINSRYDFNEASGFRNKQLQFETAALANANTRRSENAQITGSNDAISAGELIRTGKALTFPEAMKMVKKSKKKIKIKE